MNNLLRNLSLVLLIGLSTTTSFAGGGTVGNGGDVIDCLPLPGNPYPAGPLFEIFDVYEARALRGWKINLGGPTLNVREKVDLAILRMNRKDLYTPGMYALMKRYADDFWNDSVFVPNSDLTEISDTFAITIPKNCSLKQIAIQLRSPGFLEKRYVINKDLWDRLDSDNQATLILHEIIYRIALGSSATDSVGTRLISSLLFSGSIESLSWDQMLATWSHSQIFDIPIGTREVRFQGPLSDVRGNVEGFISRDYDCYSKSIGRRTACIRIKSDELYLRTIDGGHKNPYWWPYSSLTLKMNVKDTIMRWSHDSVTSENPRNYYENWHIEENSVSIYELYLGRPNSKFRLTASKNIPLPQNPTIAITDHFEILTDRYCLYAPTPQDFLADINVDKDDGKKYRIQKQQGQVCLSLAGDIIK